MPVYARARRMAINVASVPELWNRSFSTDGISALIALAHRTSSSVEAPRWVPRVICWETASAMAVQVTTESYPSPIAWAIGQNMDSG